MDGPLVTIADAAEALGRHPRTLRRWIAAGRLECGRIGGRLAISPDSLRAFLGSAGARPAQQLTTSARVNAARAALRKRHDF